MSDTSLRPVGTARGTRNDWWTPLAAARMAAALPARVLLGLIWLYRHTLSPALPAVFGPTCGCRFHPTCAVYAAQAVRERGAVTGAWLALGRLLKCHPLHPGGFDPVPPSPRRGLTCRAVFSPDVVRSIANATIEGERTTMATTSTGLGSVHFMAAREDSAFTSSEQDCPVAPVSDWRSRRSKTGPTLGCDISRGREYAG
jgi:uncharacterized protein